jgi:hypothetical protein
VEILLATGILFSIIGFLAFKSFIWLWCEYGCVVSWQLLSVVRGLYSLSQQRRVQRVVQDLNVDWDTRQQKMSWKMEEIEGARVVWLIVECLDVVGIPEAMLRMGRRRGF